MDSKKQRIIDELRAAFSELSGADMSGADADRSFLEFGFDSLFLTQAAGALKVRFGVKVTFRQLLEEFSSLDALASHLAEIVDTPSLPPSPAKTEPVQSAHVSGEQGAAGESKGPVDVPSATKLTGTVLERVVKVQLEMMEKQLAVLRQAAPPTFPGGGGAHGPIGREDTPSGDVQLRKPKVQAVPSRLDRVDRFGPFKSVERGASGGLTARQQKAVEALVSRYTVRTARSKAYAQRHRPHFCDPRAAGNFRQLWKEMVYPIVCERSQGARIWDIDGNEYIDVTMGFGANYLGHSPEYVTEAVREQLERGYEIGPQSKQAGEAAEMLCELTGMERATFCNTGSEAVMAAIRVARTVTGRNKIVFFAGDYHGIAEEMLSRPALVDGVRGAMPAAPGVPQPTNVIVLDYDDLESLQVIKARASEIAAVMVEPIQARHPDLRPHEFLKQLRKLTQEEDIALIFDEVITGFRLAMGGAQEFFGVKADLATYGKVIGGGMPIGALAGQARFMDALDGGMWRYGDDSFPEVGVTFFAGTFVRHPLAMAAAHAVLVHLKKSGPGLLQEATARTERFVNAVNKCFTERQLPMRLPSFSTVFHYEFHPDLQFAGLLFYFLRDRGVHIWEGRVGHLSVAHTDDDIDQLISAFEGAVTEMQAGGFLPETANQPTALPPPKSGGNEQDEELRVPLTPVQQEMWFAAQLGPESARTQTGSSFLRLHGRLDVEALEEAVRRLVERHECLRARFDSSGREIIISPSAAAEMVIEDLRSMSEGEQAVRVQRILEAESRRDFDLQVAPLCAFTLVRLADDEALLVFSVQMIVCDGWGYGLLLEDLGAIYSARVEKRSELPPSPPPFREYVDWLSAPEQLADAAGCEAYWCQILDPPPDPVDLPQVGARPAVRSFSGDRCVLRLDESFFDRLKQAAKKSKTTPFSFLLSAYQVWLHRLSGQQDLVVGIPFAGQAGAGMQRYVGQCVHTLPLRFNVDPDAPFSSLLSRTQSILLDAQEHWNSSLGRIVQRMGRRSDSHRMPLVSVIFNLDVPIAPDVFSGCVFEIESTPRSTFQYDLGFNLVDRGRSLVVECDYNDTVFDRDVVSAWLEGFQNMLEAVVEDPEKVVAHVPILDDHTLSVIESEVREEGRGQLDFQTVHAAVSARAAQCPDEVAVICDGRSMSYADLESRSNQFARLLQSEGVVPGVLVGFYMDRSFETVVALLGVLKAGAAYVPLDPSLPPLRVSQLFESIDLKLIVTKGHLMTSLPRTSAKIVCMDEDREVIAREETMSLGDNGRAEDLAYVMFTSGSSGVPKGVQITHGNVLNFLRSMQRKPGITRSDVVLAITTLSFDISVLELFLPLVVGARLLLVDRDVLMSPPELAGLMEQHQVSIMQATPSTWRMLLDGGWTGPAGLKVLSGGEALLPSIAGRLLAKGFELWNLYGPTETTVWSTVAHIRDQEAISIGEPIDNTTIVLCDEKMQPVPVGVPGEILIGGRGLARGYLNDPSLTEEKFVTLRLSGDEPRRWFRTGDVARCHASGMVELIGRRDSQVKIRGHRVELGEVQAVLAEHPAVQDVIATVRRNSTGDSEMAAYLVVRESGEASNGTDAEAQLRGELRGWLRSRLPDYMVPSSFVFLDALPLSSNSKVDRDALPEPSATDAVSASDYVPPRTETERELCQLWADVMKLDRVGVRDSFFDLGGQSLLAVSLFARMEKQFDLRLPLSTLFTSPTIAELAREIEGAHETSCSAWKSLVPIQPEGTGRQIFLVHGAGGNVLLYRSLAEHVGKDFRIYGLQSRGLDGGSEPLRSIESMAQAYLEEIREVQPRGPYYLGGYCLGGTVAYEMAQQLVEQGERVGAVFMLDTYNFSRALKSSFTAFVLEKLRFHAANLMQLRPRLMLRYLAEKIRIARDGELAGLMASRPHSGSQEGVARATTGVEATVQAINDRAAEEYSPKPYNGQLTLFKPHKNYKFYPDPLMGWGDLALGGLDVVELPINPHAMLVEPFVKRLAEEVVVRMNGAIPVQRQAASQTEPVPTT